MAMWPAHHAHATGADHVSKGTKSFPGLHVADEICIGILADACIRYMRVRMPVAHKGEWRPNDGGGEQNNKSRRRGANSGKII